MIPGIKGVYNIIKLSCENKLEKEGQLLARQKGNYFTTSSKKTLLPLPSWLTSKMASGSKASSVAAQMAAMLEHVSCLGFAPVFSSEKIWKMLGWEIAAFAVVVLPFYYIRLAYVASCHLFNEPNLEGNTKSREMMLGIVASIAGVYAALLFRKPVRFATEVKSIKLEPV